MANKPAAPESPTRPPLESALHSCGFFAALLAILFTQRGHGRNIGGCRGTDTLKS
jgi:hypothetical protein